MKSIVAATMLALAAITAEPAAALDVCVSVRVWTNPPGEPMERCHRVQGVSCLVQATEVTAGGVAVTICHTTP